MSGTFLHWLSNATDRTYEIVSFTFNTSL